MVVKMMQKERSFIKIWSKSTCKKAKMQKKCIRLLFIWDANAE